MHRLNLRIQIKPIKEFDVEILDKVAEINGWDLDKSSQDLMQRSMQFKLVKQMHHGGMTKTTEREKVFTMSDTYYDTKVVIATTKADKINEVQPIKREDSRCQKRNRSQRFLDKNKDKYGYKIKTF